MKKIYLFLVVLIFSVTYVHSVQYIVSDEEGDELRMTKRDSGNSTISEDMEVESIPEEESDSVKLEVPEEDFDDPDILEQAASATVEYHEPSETEILWRKFQCQIAEIPGVIDLYAKLLKHPVLLMGISTVSLAAIIALFCRACRV